jgi:phospholipid/cholesterol/gamma-HCH transport system permease protein
MASQVEPAEAMANLSYHAGHMAEAALAFVGDGLMLSLEAIGFTVRGRARSRTILQQMGTIGADSLLLCILILFFGGMVLGMNTAKTAVQFGASGLVGGAVAVSIARELGPTFAGILVAARAGSAMAAEIGSMSVTEQIDAMRALAVSPVRYLVVPRLLAAIIMLPLLTIIADIFGGVGAFIISLQAGVSASKFINSASAFLTNWDLYGGLAKTVIFAIIIVITCCRQGLRARGGAVGVGRATTSAVVISIVLILISDYFLTALLQQLMIQNIPYGQ